MLKNIKFENVLKITLSFFVIISVILAILLVVSNYNFYKEKRQEFSNIFNHYVVSAEDALLFTDNSTYDFNFFSANHYWLSDMLDLLESNVVRNQNEIEIALSTKDKNTTIELEDRFMDTCVSLYKKKEKKVASKSDLRYLSQIKKKADVLIKLLISENDKLEKNIYYNVNFEEIEKQITDFNQWTWAYDYYEQVPDEFGIHNSEYFKAKALKILSIEDISNVNFTFENFKQMEYPHLYLTKVSIRQNDKLNVDVEFDKITGDFLSLKYNWIDNSGISNNRVIYKGNEKVEIDLSTSIRDSKVFANYFEVILQIIYGNDLKYTIAYSKAGGKITWYYKGLEIDSEHRFTLGYSGFSITDRGIQTRKLFRDIKDNKINVSKEVVLSKLKHLHPKIKYTFIKTLIRHKFEDRGYFIMHQFTNLFTHNDIYFYSLDGKQLVYT